MALIIATGSNQGNSIDYLQKAKNLLQENFHLKAESRIYQSQAVDYLNQPDFLNQVLEFEVPALSPLFVLNQLHQIENSLSRKREIPKGPRTIDLDIIFWGLEEFNHSALIIPHPSWNQRSFVVRPLSELPFFKTIEKCFTIPKTFDIEARPIL